MTCLLCLSFLWRISSLFWTKKNWHGAVRFALGSIKSHLASLLGNDGVKKFGCLKNALKAELGSSCSQNGRRTGADTSRVLLPLNGRGTLLKSLPSFTARKYLPH